MIKREGAEVEIFRLQSIRPHASSFSLISNELPHLVRTPSNEATTSGKRNGAAGAKRRAEGRILIIKYIHGCTSLTKVSDSIVVRGLATFCEKCTSFTDAYLEVLLGLLVLTFLFSN